jgi:hypothetical protein
MPAIGVCECGADRRPDRGWRSCPICGKSYATTPIDLEKFAEWRAAYLRVVGTMAESPDVARIVAEAFPALIAEVERLRAESVFTSDPRGEPPVWVEVTVRASDPETKARAARDVREGAEMREVLGELRSFLAGLSPPVRDVARGLFGERMERLLAP